MRLIVLLICLVQLLCRTHLKNKRGGSFNTLIASNFFKKGRMLPRSSSKKSEESEESGKNSDTLSKKSFKKKIQNLAIKMIKMLIIMIN